MGPKYISRRDLLKIAAAAGASSLIPGCGAINKAASTVSGGGTGASTCAKLTDIENVVIVIQENRSFDHYFGSYKGARGFSEISNAYKQPFPSNATATPTGLLYPFHLDTSKWNAACTHDIDHSWLAQHQSWNNGAKYGKLTYTTMPEQLQSRGISWKIYSSADSSIGNGLLSSDNVLPFFKNYQDSTTPLYKNAFGPQFPTDFVADAASGNLPQVSWIIPSVVESDHPPSPSLLGELTLATIINALTANSAQWAKTVLFVTYDENGGFFDHVAPPTAPPGTPGEYITVAPVPDASVLRGISGPIGLGFRVPMLVISPFTRGGFISSDTFDHTSVLRFLETRFGAEVPNLSAWRRATVGDMTSAFNFSKPDLSVPVLPTLNAADTTLINGCISALTGTTPYPIPNPQTLPTQESGTATRPNSSC
ncbi:alkaline phosphatase family protein [Terriglobus sp. YAF25]|uniref:alkaline phosphatase family protein n=1 Tax=Terriglobus sp. YAF25 TaxID=3233080 RepID=UPI003F9598C3